MGRNLKLVTIKSTSGAFLSSNFTMDMFFGLKKIYFVASFAIFRHFNLIGVDAFLQIAQKWKDEMDENNKLSEIVSKTAFTLGIIEV